MESTETIENKPLTIEEAVSGLISPELTGEATETVEEETQATEEETIEASDENAEVEELTAESDTEEVEASDEVDEEVEEIEASAEDEIDNDYEEDAVQEDDSELIAVKVDGQIQNVTLEELKQGYSGQEYVQKGMQENARMKKEVEGVYQALMNERQQVQQLIAQAKQGTLAEPQMPSEDLMDSDPVRYLDEVKSFKERKAQYDEQMKKVQQVTAQQSQAQQIAQQKYLEGEMEQLKRVIPEFADSKKASVLKEQLVTGGNEYYGYTPDEIGQVMDHRAIRVLRDAIEYRKIKAGKTNAVQKSTKKKVVKAGAKKVNDGKSKVRQKQMAKLKQTGSIQDAVSLIMNS